MKLNKDIARQAQMVAGLFCEGHSMHDISSSMAYDDEQQTRSMLEIALREGYFRYEPILSIKDYDDDLYEFLNNETLTLAIANALSDTLELQHFPVRITHSPRGMFANYQANPKTDSKEYEQYLKSEVRSLKSVGRRAAMEIKTLLFNGRPHTVGLNYGAAVLFTVRSLTPLPSQVTEPMKIVSLFGDLGYSDRDELRRTVNEEVTMACNDIVTLFANQLGKHAKPELLSVPVYIPHEFTVDDTMLKAIHKFLTSHSSYTKIFGTSSGRTQGRDAEALISNMDSIITGFGSPDSHSQLHNFLSTWLNEQEIVAARDFFRRGEIVGDIGGHFITPPRLKQLSTDLKNFLERNDRCLIAAKPSDFTAVAEWHAKHPSTGAGVVGVAAGARKAKILHALLAQSPCPISRLVIDSHCAMALLYLISSKRYHDLMDMHGVRILQDSETWSEGTIELIPN